MITVNYEYKLKPNAQQIETFESWLNVCKKVYLQFSPART
ncbi:helix-turn-helix domain-containing protein [Microseira sp. BLCC-F43]